MKWYIDAFDGLGGLAFASYRESDLTSKEPDLSGAAWVIGAPDFQPRPVSSRVIGWAAAQRGLQLGFFVEEETEVAFPSLAALTDFVRRVYIAGGGGDGGGGIVPPGGGAPPGPEGGGDKPPGLRSPSGWFATVARPLKEFAFTHSAGTEGITGTEQIAIEVSEMSVDSGAVRMPGPLEQIGALLGYELNARWQAVDRSDPEALHALGLSTINYLALAEGLRIRNVRQWIVPIERCAYISHTHVFRDPLDVLASLPIPQWVTKSLKGHEDWRSVKDLFFGVLANPALLVATHYDDDRAILFIFASVVQVRCGAPLDYSSADGWLLDIEYTALMAEVLEWLRPQMPKYAFTPELEAVIRGMSR